MPREVVGPGKRLAALAAWSLAWLAWPASGGEPPAEGSIRVATFNTSLNRPSAGELIGELRGGKCRQARLVAAILKSVRPDVVLLNELDYDQQGEAAELFVRLYLESDRDGEPLRYPHRFQRPVNTGLPTGRDLDRDGQADGPGDAFGFGRFPGQYGMLLLSRFPIPPRRARTFQRFLWSDMPRALWPSDPATGQAYYEPAAREALRLSSKSHWDVPVSTPRGTLHVLASHPTPPVFDGPEDRNGCRNHDEIRLWADYVGGRGGYLYDDEGVKGGLPAGASFVVLGDLNADPQRGDSRAGAIGQLLRSPAISDPRPRGAGETSGATADFGRAGRLRVDYALPSRTLQVTGSGVFWPAEDDPRAQWLSASDHRLVWVDLR